MIRRRHHSSWSEQYDERLVRLWGNLDVTIETISARLSRSEGFIRYRAAELGLPARSALRGRNQKAA